MAYEQRELSGSVFPNQKKTSDKHPDFTGRCLIDGRTYWVSAWNKESGKGPWVSLAFKPADDSDQQRRDNEESI
jgi:hypothetical protein